MSSRYHHIHVVCAAHDQPLVLGALAVFFRTRAFLTYDISIKLAQASLYGRQCIDACDYAIVIVGDSYGHTQNMGASQMHLSYLSAKAKLKPMITLIKTHDTDTDMSRQLKEFVRLVEQQANHVYYYDDSTDIEQLLTFAYGSMVASHHVAASWVKVQDDKGVETIVTPSITPKPSVAVMANNTLNSTDNEAVTDNVTDSLTESLELAEQFDIKYSAQAFEGGTLTDVKMIMALTWQEVLQALATIPLAFSNYGLKSCINRLIAIKAAQDIKKSMPNVHAVSRCQIEQDDLVKLQRLLIAANWIQLTASSSKTSQELWKLTFYAKKTFEDSESKVSE